LICTHIKPGGTPLTPCRRVTEQSVLTVQIFDQKKFKKKDQGFLGVVNVVIGSVIPDLEAGGDGTPPVRLEPANARRNAHKGS
jgi:E3 ubiquitin-protein ligase NEDD4